MEPGMEHPYDVIVLKEGYSLCLENGRQKADGTITLIKGAHRNVLVDTGSPWDKEYLINALSLHNLAPCDISHVVCTHGHSDHVGNLNLFMDALCVVSCDICRRDEYLDSPLYKGEAFPIDEHIEVIATPGHTGGDVSVVVRGTAEGTVVVAGDLFECEDDETSWRECSEQPIVQLKNRTRVKDIADVIIPGHGPKFKNNKGNNQ